jgi:hypothetical protein
MMRLCVNAQDIPTQYESNRVYLRFTIQIWFFFQFVWLFFFFPSF